MTALTIGGTLTVPATPAELGFDADTYPAWRKGQREITQHIIDWYLNPEGTHVMMLEAPTGIGKSLIAGAVAVMLDEFEDHQHHTLITTTTLNLQRQYTNDTLAGMAKSAWGRSNYPCVAFPPSDCSDAPCSVGWECSMRSQCGYYSARDAAHLSPTTVLNTAFYLTATNNVELNDSLAKREPWRGAAYIYSGANLIIHDEAHVLERAVRSVVEGEINRRFFERNGMELPKVKEYGTWDAWIDNHIDAVRQMADQHREDAKASARSGQKLDDFNGKQAVAAETQLRWIKYSLLPTRPLIEGVGTHQNVTFKPVWGKHFAERYLWRHGERHLLMSATIPYPKYLAETLGLADDDWSFVRLDSPFPLMSRRIIYAPVMRVNRKTTPIQFAQLIARMDDWIDKHHTTEKGIVHTVSYDRAKSILIRSRHHKRMISHEPGKGKKERAIEEFLDAPPGAILVSPSVGVGEDFGRGENCRFQFFVKYPIPSLGDPVTKARAEEVPDSLWFEADMAFIQAVGRGTRSATDFCVNYVLDGGAGRRMAKFPESLRKTIVKGG